MLGSLTVQGSIFLSLAEMKETSGKSRPTEKDHEEKRKKQEGKESKCWSPCLAERGTEAPAEISVKKCWPWWSVRSRGLLSMLVRRSSLKKCHHRPLCPLIPHGDEVLALIHTHHSPPLHVCPSHPVIEATILDAWNHIPILVFSPSASLSLGCLPIKGH